MANLTDFLPDVRAEVTEALDASLTVAIRWAVRQFCRRSQAYQAQLADLVLTLNSAGPYTPTMPADAELELYQSAAQNGIPLDIKTKRDMDDIDFNWQVQTGSQLLAMYPISETQVNVYPIPTDVTYPVQIWAVLCITKDALTCPDFILDKWQDTITAGAVGRMLNQTDKTWTDKDEAQRRLAEFWVNVEKAEHRVRRGYSSKPRFARVPFFAGGDD